MTIHYQGGGPAPLSLRRPQALRETVHSQDGVKLGFSLATPSALAILARWQIQ